jgi:ribosomal 50S subunit-recycling heat shock protein
MRLDKFLQLSRLIRRRALANAFCDGGHVRINDRPAKAASPVAAGDVLRLDFGHRVLRVRVLAVPERPPQGRGTAPTLYVEIPEDGEPSGGPP